ncbi:LEAF RUST 10 DISEASE-RESISTANCE LOCUS RECEPTOR-LIKE PROTEIN KINASE-like 2.1 [Iris pallida]|uniref:non-specific serine/threonine protein kinase n=1 Tax=Iris pallida TaxID=29817 RepID=A0AAX6DNZ5_IRIPA|nr:LEAF RUST 10 DISEASE-RESISTANCE LOCUS RECEPTOR-LIKE PROTEIN KINASE-like 2.1 [Iris pallida]
MAVFLSRPSTVLLLLFFFITTTGICSPLPCPVHPSCDQSIDIHHPFYMEDSGPGCKGTCLIRCIASKAMIEFKGHYLHVKDIDYDEKTITVEDEQFTTDHPNLACSFLYNFAHPILHFDGPNYSSIIYNIPISDDCKWGEDSFAPLSRRYSYSVCRDFSFYYWRTESEKDLSDQWVSPRCQAQKPRVFELKLSFSAPDHGEGMSLLSAGFSAYALKLHSDCFYANVCSNKDSEKTNHVKKTAIDIVGGTVALVTACGIVICCYCRIYRKKSLNNDKNVENFLKKHGSLAPKRYKYSDVKKITESFRNKLGQGGYGSVFKGTLIDGRLVAVKVLSDSKGNGEDFFNEIASTSRSSHVNIVNLLGFCSEGSKRALIYEYMCNGSLDKLICSKEPKTTLRWEKFYQIAIGIARGLEYLHRGCNTRIVHFDIKPHNILLDEDFRPKISGFLSCASEKTASSPWKVQEAP